MKPRYQDGSFQTAADMLRNQQREFVEPLMQQMAANLGDTLAASISFAVRQAVQVAQNRDVMPRRETDYGTSQHRLLLGTCPEVQTLLRRYHKEVEGRMDKLFTQKAIAEKYAERSRKRQMHQDLQSEKDKHWQWAKEYKLVATPADFEEPSLEYDVEGARKKMRAAHADEGWKFVQHHQNVYRAHLERACAPAYVQQEAVDQATPLLSRHQQLYDASVLEEQYARVNAWAQLVVRQGFVVKAEQLRAKQDMQQTYGIKVRPNSGKNPGALRAKTLRSSRQSSLTSRLGRSNSRATEVERFGDFKDFRACQECWESKERQQQSPPKDHFFSPAGTALAKAKVVVEAAAEDVPTATRA